MEGVTTRGRKDTVEVNDSVVPRVGFLTSNYCLSGAHHIRGEAEGQAEARRTTETTSVAKNTTRPRSEVRLTTVGREFEISIFESRISIGTRAAAAQRPRIDLRPHPSPLLLQLSLLAAGRRW